MTHDWRPIVRAQAIVAQDFQLPRRLMQEQDLTDAATVMRQTAYFVAWMASAHRPIAVIARKFGRDAATVRHGIRVTFDRMLADGQFSARVRRLVNEVERSNPHYRLANPGLASNAG